VSLQYLAAICLLLGSRQTLVTGGIEEALMTATEITTPRFSQDQQVCFVGGVGMIRSCRPNSGTWTYTVEMEMGPEPAMGRVGAETTILLYEAEIQGVINKSIPECS
jgi:hypothetical protein